MGGIRQKSVVTATIPEKSMKEIDNVKSSRGVTLTDKIRVRLHELTLPERKMAGQVVFLGNGVHARITRIVGTRVFFEALPDSAINANQQFVLDNNDQKLWLVINDDTRAKFYLGKVN